MDSTVLLGAEDVRAGGNAIERAASEMSRAAGTIEYALRQHQEFMDGWLARFEEVVARLAAGGQTVGGGS